MLTMLLTACNAIVFKAVNLPSYMHSELQLKKNLVYGDKPYQKLDLYLPKDPATAKGQLLIFVYGGAWVSGAKEHYYFVAETFTAAGYAVAIPDYIKYPKGEFPSFVEDIALAIAWLSQHGREYTDINQLIMMGHSAGAHIGALLLTDPKYLAAQQLSPDAIDAFIGLAGPYGFTPKNKKFQNIFGNLDDYSQMQPLHFVTGKEPAMLLLQGNDDSIVIPVNTRKFAEKINSQGGAAEANFYDGRGHFGIMLPLSRLPGSKDDVVTTILNFLQRQANTQ